MDRASSQARLVNFRLLYLVTQLVGAFLLLLVLSWILIHLGGFGYSVENPKILFNWHPICMIIFVFLLGNSILIYRGFRYAGKKSLKVAHAFTHGLAFFIALFGLIAVFDSHNYAIPKIPNLYSLHSWIGLSAVIIFIGQYIAGFTFYLFPKFKESLRIFYMPLHVFFGLIAFILCLIAVLMGLTEKAIFSMTNDYQNLPSHAMLVNTIGLMTALFGSLVIYLVTEPSYKREPLPEDSMLLTGDHE
ncbi:hypothetical protein PVAND_004566 [Polypedilum vanderplanki]|uniref:Cytochrome b561 domain-containing protein n=1 Tax=Polypedilum vanderplanki TaxID=319348 RepID=A0A9J6BXI8_POLVA|nr:hypothetical protein PVAND_004566 [Polypedilum vanderplanki]